MTRLFNYKSHLQFAYTVFGDGNGYPVLVQHGMIASIQGGHLFDRLVHSGARVICVARPGYGESSAYGMCSLAEWGAIIGTLADELNLAKFDVLGISSGAPYSYAIGAARPERVRRVFVFSGTPALFDEQVQSLWPYPVDQHASIEALQDLAKGLFFANVSNTDRLRNDIRDSMRNDCFGIALDLRLRCRDWGFDMARVVAPVHMAHGRDDDQVPLKTAEITAGLLPNCHLKIRGQGGHFSAELLDKFIKTTMIELKT